MKQRMQYHLTRKYRAAGFCMDKSFDQEKDAHKRKTKINQHGYHSKKDMKKGKHRFAMDLFSI
ncbi:MAG: hypothetical protein XD44_0100 [Methanobacteriaceae archaeon 41_258]|nr:MAG: hypothetical protein XD44_0100 [Methanobacteriaceae archaeon 41_258]